MYKAAKIMYQLFAGRQDTYSVQRHRNGKLGYFRVEGKELTPDNYFQHLNGEEVLGVYPLLVDGNANFACIDMDTNDLTIVRAVRDLCPQPNHLECSRSGNYHLWFFFSKATNTEELKDKLQSAVTLGNTLIKDDHCGLYPIPQPRGAVGILIALPLQGKGIENGRSVFVHEDGVPFEDQLEHLAEIKQHGLIGVRAWKAFSLEAQVAKLQNVGSEGEAAIDPSTILEDKDVYDLYVGRNKQGGDQTASGYDFALATILSEKGLSKSQASTLLSMRPMLHTTQPGYLEKTIDAGFAFADKKRKTNATRKSKGKNNKKQKGGARAEGTRDPEEYERELEQQQQLFEESYAHIKPLERDEYVKQMSTTIIFFEEQRRLFDIFFAALISNLKTTGRPVWLFLVGPPGCGKTLPMMTIQNSPYAYVVSAFRPAALISGWGMTSGQDMSLIPKLNNKVLLVKDMSSLLSQNKEVVAEILGLLRDAYDGSCSKAFGTGVQRSYVSRFGFIGATTPEIDANWSMNVRLGERFLRYRIKTPPEQIYLKIDSALTHLQTEDDTELRLEEICLGYLKYLLRKPPENESEVQDDATEITEVTEPKEIPLPRLSMQKEIGRLAQLGAILRSGVSRAPFNNQVLVLPEWEEATRFAKQLAKMAISLAFIRGKETNGQEEFDDIKAFVRDGMDGRTEAICKLLYSTPGLDASEVAKRINLPDWTARQIIQDLEILRVLVRIRDGGTGMAPKYDYVPWIRGKLDFFKLWENNGELINGQYYNHDTENGT